MINFTTKIFSDLSNEELYKILQLRINVFVVEQNCPYPDLDDKDQHAWHVFGVEDEKFVAYARVLAPGVSYSTPAIGRVLTAQSVRRKNYGRLLMVECIKQIEKLFPGHGITISAQSYLKDFYTSFGFTIIGDEYLEDDIPHVKMIRPRM